MIRRNEMNYPMPVWYPELGEEGEYIPYTEVKEHFLKGYPHSGRRGGGRSLLFLDGLELDNEIVLAAQKRFGYPRHSPDGFTWGYLGSGCAQSAFGILYYIHADVKGYQNFKELLIARLPFNQSFAVKFSWPVPNEQFKIE
jgi:hypothetical protein